MNNTQTDNIPHILKFKDIRSRKRAYIPDVQGDGESDSDGSGIQSRKRAHSHIPKIRYSLTICETLRITRPESTEEYEMWTETSRPQRFIVTTDSKEPMSPRQLIRFFRQMAERGCANRFIFHNNGVVERWIDEGYEKDDPYKERTELNRFCKKEGVEPLPPIDPRKEERRIQRYLKEHEW